MVDIVSASRAFEVCERAIAAFRDADCNRDMLRAPARSLEDALIGTRKEGLSVKRAIVSMESRLAVSGCSTMVIQQVEKGTLVQIQYALENDEIRLTIVKFERGVRSGAPPGSLRPTSLRTAASIRPARTLAAEDGPSANESDELEFCHSAAEAHGGTLTAGGSSLYRMCLPWVESKLRR